MKSFYGIYIRRIFLLLLFLTHYTHAHSQIYPWGSWNKYPCWEGILCRFKADGSWDNHASSNIMWVGFFNQYNTPVSFNFRVVSPTDAIAYKNGQIKTVDRIVTLQPGQTKTGWDAVSIPSSSSQVDVIIDQVRFGPDDSRNAGGYAVCGSNSNSVINNNQNSSNTVASKQSSTPQSESNLVDQQNAQALKQQQQAAAQRQALAEAENARRLAAVQTYTQTVATNQSLMQQNQQDLSQIANVLIANRNENEAIKEKNREIQEQNDIDRPWDRDGMTAEEAEQFRIDRKCDEKYEQGIEYWQKGEHETANNFFWGANLKHWTFHADARYYQAMFFMEEKLKAYKQAYLQFYDAAYAGYAPAKYQLALFLYEGFKCNPDYKVKKNENTAIKLMREAALAGVPEAQKWVSEHQKNKYLKDPNLAIPNVLPDFVQTFTLSRNEIFKKYALMLGGGDLFSNANKLFFNQNGKWIDLKESTIMQIIQDLFDNKIFDMGDLYCRVYSDAGWAGIQEMFAEILQNGAYGYEKNPDLALQWYQKSAARGNAKAIAKLKELTH